MASAALAGQLACGRPLQLTHRELRAESRAEQGPAVVGPWGHPCAVTKRAAGPAGGGLIATFLPVTSWERPAAATGSVQWGLGVALAPPCPTCTAAVRGAPHPSAHGRVPRTVPFRALVTPAGTGGWRALTVRPSCYKGLSGNQARGRREQTLGESSPALFLLMAPSSRGPQPRPVSVPPQQAGHSLRNFLLQ